MSDIERKIERSSLGTKNARAARRTVSPADAARVVSQAAAMSKRASQKKTGGQPRGRTYTSGEGRSNLERPHER